MKHVTEELIIGKGLKLIIDKQLDKSCFEIRLTIGTDEKCLLHWGVCSGLNEQWRIPPDSIRPEETKSCGPDSVQTPFTKRCLRLRIPVSPDRDKSFSHIVFVLFFPEQDRWDNNNGKNFYISIPGPDESLFSPRQTLDDELGKKEPAFIQNYNLPGHGELVAAVVKEDDLFRLHLVADIPGSLILHWGVAIKNRFEWRLPLESHRPSGSKIVDEKTVQTPFTLDHGTNRLLMEFNEQDAPLGIPFVVHRPDTGEWINSGKGNFFIPINLPTRADTPFETPELSEIAAEIINIETGKNSWALMHRFNLCYDLLDKGPRDAGLLSLLFVWLRFSAIRQLDWQRNFNTKPRELSHAQKRLTIKLASVYRDTDTFARDMARRMISTVGRGGEGDKGQRIRDDILKIMHCHHIKEVTGHFMEEWHQKIHNNATPDDIVICEAYLGFLYSNGDLERFYKILENGGVSKERLKSFERPIVTDPDFNPHIKDGLAHDLENYLRLLKSIHLATDLSSAIESCSHCLDEQVKEQVAFIYHSRDNRGISLVDRVDHITEARRTIIGILGWFSDEYRIRDIIYLDLALEEFLRVVVEQKFHEKMGGDQLRDLIGMVAENLSFSHDCPGLSKCASHWQRLKMISNREREWSLQAISVLERMTHNLGTFIDGCDRLMQSKAEHLGKAFNADSWTISLFTQEIVRGSLAFLLSGLLRRMDPILRKSADLGDWRVISRSETAGRVEIKTLASIQDKKFDPPALIITDTVSGDEEIPDGVVGVVTPAGVDILSHVSVRARNVGVLFATCFSTEIIDELKSFKGRVLNFSIDGSGDVTFEEVREKKGAKKRSVKETAPTPARFRRVKFTKYAISPRDFNVTSVGGKSNHLINLKTRLPDWIHIPRSIAIPFCTCEKVLGHTLNAEFKKQYTSLSKQVAKKPSEILPKLKSAIMALAVPNPLRNNLRDIMKFEKMEWPENWNRLWECIKTVWASKWNERAYWSREKWRIKHSDIRMAVLIQEVVDAEYAFVIHTANPFTGNRAELYAEVVVGLGDILCSGNYPGRAFSFTCRKGKKLIPEVITYPSKGVALRGKGLIIRSDSNGEDLTDYSGAGIYDSMFFEPIKEEILDYTNNPLLWDHGFSRKFLRTITRLGMEIEKIMGRAPQDIEGAYSNGKFYVVQTRPQVGIMNDEL
ncbi:MAG: PEP/pyruvate-binding domain-containing protein [Thermodesulfobacteriota bacterium]|nr:PEP/pyruvate-binding domain-containing protein [Thermodesulfobacteriota bacterium]